MNKVLAILLMGALLSACHWSNDIVTYETAEEKTVDTPESKFYKIYVPEVFNAVDSCQLIGFIENTATDAKAYVNSKCQVRQDTIFLNFKPMENPCLNADCIYRDQNIMHIERDL